MQKTLGFLLKLALFQLALGIGLILGSLLTSPTVACYEWIAERLLAKQYSYVASKGLNENNDIVLQPYDLFNHGETAALPVVSLHRSSSLNSFATYPPNPMDYTVLFRHLYEQGAQRVYVMAPLNWEEEPDDIVKAAIGYELDRFPHRAMGRQMSESSRQTDLPPSWKALVIPPDNIAGKTDLFPRADKLLDGMPQLTTSAPGVGTIVENNELFSVAGKKVSQPLFVRWGTDIIPTLPVIAALNALDLKPSDIKIIPGVRLSLGDKRSIKLDEYGRIPLSAQCNPTLVDTKEVIIPIMSGLRPPDTTAIRKLLSSADAVLVSEPSALSDEPDTHALLTAQTIRSIMGAMAPAPAVLIPEVPSWIQWVITLDVLLLSIWALRFRRKGRFMVWSACLAFVLVVAGYLLSAHHIWLPVMIPTTAVLSLGAAGCLLKPYAPPTTDDDDEEDDDDEPTETAVGGEGIAHVLPPDNPYQEPNEIPIPHRSQQDHSDS